MNQQFLGYQMMVVDLAIELCVNRTATWAVTLEVFIKYNI